MDPSNPRSLVGATMGARKRWVREHVAPHLWRNRDPKGAYQTMRRELRIGERLRPCPGCPKCNEWAEEFDCRCTDEEKVWYLHDPESSHPCDWSCGEEMRGSYCDGSGVLPAHRAQRSAPMTKETHRGEDR